MATPTVIGPAIEPTENYDLATKEQVVFALKDDVVTEKPYDPRPQEDSARRRIAYLLIGILGGIILWSLVFVTIWPNTADIAIKLLQLLLSPIVALVAAATGFYFGAKSKK